MNAIELIAALKGADEETAMELVDRLQCGEIDCSVLPTGKDNAVQQAQVWAQEARTQKGIVDEIGKLVGCSNDWEMVGAVKAALSANGGEAEPVAWVVFADNGNIRIWGREKPEAFPDAAPLYLAPTVKGSLTVQNEPIGYADPDTLTDYRAGDRLHIPVYRPDASADWQDGIPVYLHPAPPSVAVPEGWKLVPIEPTDEMRAAGHMERDRSPTNRNPYHVWRAMLTAAPSPDHSGDAGKVVCRAPDGRCRACAHYFGKADRCDYATPSVPENDAGADAVIQFKDELLKSVKPIFRPHIEGVCAVVLERLRTAGDEGEGV